MISLVGFELASRTGPCQVTSKKHLIPMVDGDVENDLIDDGVECGKGREREVLVRRGSRGAVDLSGVRMRGRFAFIIFAGLRFWRGWRAKMPRLVYLT